MSEGSGLREIDPNEPVSPFGKWLRETRKERSMSQEELARRDGLSYLTISYIETGRTQSPRPSTVEKLQRALEEDIPAEAEQDLQLEQKLAGFGDYYGPFPREDWEEHAEEVACVYAFYDSVGRPVRIGETGHLRTRMRQYKDDCWWFREPTVETFAYVVMDDEETRKRIEKILIKLVGSRAIFNRQHTI